MINARKKLTYLSALGAVLSIASCSNPGSEGTAPERAASQHRFNVYFDVARSDITPEAQQVIAQAVAQANQNANAKILVVTPETDKARRSNKVQAALVAAGVAPDRIDTRWIGPQEAPPTGVRDPRNRVVEISFAESDSSIGDTPKLLLSKQSGN